MKVIEAKFDCPRCKVSWLGLLQQTVKLVGEVEVIQWEPVAVSNQCPECAKVNPSYAWIGTEEREYNETETL